MSKKYNFKEFFLSSWAIDNRTTIFVLSLIIVVGGLVSFQNLPKENFPEIKIPTIYVGTPYPGTSPEDIENLVTRKIEKELKSIKGIDEIKSTSIQDFSTVIIEFETDVDLDEAKRNVQEAVDRAKSELPNDLPTDPNVQDINLSELPIMYINVSGQFDNASLKRYAEDLQEEIEKLGEIQRVDIVGALEKEVQVNVNLYKMQDANLSFYDIESAISGENITISGGEIDYDRVSAAIRVNGEFETIAELRNMVVRGGRGNSVYLREIATVEKGFKERESYARLDGNPVVTLNIVKKAGENLIDASDKIKVLLEEMQATKLPDGLEVTVSNDQSRNTRNTLQELINTIIIGFILVTLVLMFFMGIRDALFVGLAVPLSSFVAFMILPFIGFTMNLVVLFTFILALGIVVDNAIVVIENTYRILNEEGLPIVEAAKKAAGEVIAPVFAGTLTTMAPFLPLIAWEGTTGEFMFFLPITMLITLGASLIVAYVINPVFAVSFMKPEKDLPKKINWIRLGVIAVILAVLGVMMILSGSAKMLGGFLLFLAVMGPIEAIVLRPMIKFFQNYILAGMKNIYRAVLIWSLRGWNPAVVMVAMFLLLIGSFVAFGISNPKVIQFPDADPNFVYVYNTLPIGTDTETTDSITRLIEERVYEVIGRDNPAVKSVVTNVAVGAGDPNSMERSAKSNKSKVAIEFVEFKYRNGVSTAEYLEQIREKAKGIPGSEIVVDKEPTGPPQLPPVNIEITAEDFEELVAVSRGLKSFLDSVDIVGIEELKMDLELNKPELLVNIDREKASQLGVSTGQIGSNIRTAVFGKEVSKFRYNEDEYPIQLRVEEGTRDDLSALLNMDIRFRDQSSGQFRAIPISALADISFRTTYGGINRKDLKKSVTINSNLLTGYNAVEINKEIEYWVNEYRNSRTISSDVNFNLEGETKEQEETAAFLGGAMMVSVLLILLILVTQFNSVANVFIILSQVLFSVSGVLFGYAFTGMEFSVVMSGVGIISLAGIVVNNGIILLDFFSLLRKDGTDLKEAIIEGGAIRFSPVLLTASSTVLGLVPLAIALNLNFTTLLTELDPQVFLGGDNAAFWGPLSWTIIFGLTFATVVTLVVVPVMYYIFESFKLWFVSKTSN